MYSMDEIFARLQRGEKVEDIANEVADAINGAVAKLEEEQTKKLQETKIHDAAERAAAAFNELLVYYDVTKEKMTAEDVIGLMKSVVEVKGQLETVIDSISAAKPQKRAITSEEKLDNFLRDWNLR